MDPVTIGIITGGANLIGGIISDIIGGKNKERDLELEQIQLERERQLAEQQRQLQKEKSSQTTKLIIGAGILLLIGGGIFFAVR